MFFPIVKAWNGDGKSVEWRSSKAFSLVFSNNEIDLTVKLQKKSTYDNNMFLFPFLTSILRVCIL